MTNTGALPAPGLSGPQVETVTSRALLKCAGACAQRIGGATGGVARAEPLPPSQLMDSVFRVVSPYLHSPREHS